MTKFKRDKIVLADYDIAQDRLLFQSDLWIRLYEANGVYDRAVKITRALPAAIVGAGLGCFCLGLAIGKVMWG